MSCAHPRAKVNYAARSKRLRMDLVSYKSTEGVHDAKKSLSLVQRAMRGSRIVG